MLPFRDRRCLSEKGDDRGSRRPLSPSFLRELVTLSPELRRLWGHPTRIPPRTEGETRGSQNFSQQKDQSQCDPLLPQDGVPHPEPHVTLTPETPPKRTRGSRTVTLLLQGRLPPPGRTPNFGDPLTLPVTSSRLAGPVTPDSSPSSDTCAVSPDRTCEP